MSLPTTGNLGPMEHEETPGVSDPGDADHAGAVVTGVAAVDAVVSRVAAVADQPLREHAGVFTEAHETLRRALDDLDAVAAPPAPASDAADDSL